VVFFDVERVALVVQELDVPFRSPVKNHTHIPRALEDLGVFDSYLVIDVVGVLERVALHHVQVPAMEIARAIAPGPVGEVNRIRQQGVAVPVSTRIPHPPLDGAGGVRASVQIDETVGVRVLIKDGENRRAWALKDLERMTRVRYARNAQKVALRFRVRSG